MAELDEKLLKALDDRLNNMLTTITSLDSVLNTVVANSKSSLTELISLFQASGASLTDMLQAFKGNKLADLLGIQDAAGQVKQLNEQIETLNRNTKMGGKASWVEDKDTGRGSWKVLEGDEFKNGKEERDAINALAEARQKLRDLTLSDSQLWEKIVALINKAAVETQKEESAKEREFQKAVKQQEELARKKAEIEKLRADVFGDRPYGKLSGKEKMQWIEYDDSLKKIKQQMEEIEKSSTGSKAEGERIFKEQEAIAKAKLDLAEKEKKAKEEAARQEKELNKAIADEARRNKEDENEYLRLLRERNKLLEQNARLSENRRNAGLTGYIDTSNYFGSQREKNDARLSQLDEEIKLYEESVKLSADGQRRKEEMELAHENRMTEIKVQGEQKREQILDRSSKKRQSDDERNARKAESIQKQADTLSKRRIDLNNEISRIEHDRVIRQRTNTNISQQALDAEAKKYQALKDMVDQLTKSLEELEKKQKGVTAKAEAKNAPYQQYTQAKEEERVNAELERRNKLLKDNKITMDSMLPTLQRLASAFGVAFSVRGLAQFGKKLIETRGEFEMQFVAMKQIIGDVDAATKIWNQTMQQALQSPFKAMQLVTYTKQLAAYRIETEKLFDTTKRLADISAGLGVDMGRLILAYGQVKSANFLRASEIRQFTEAGVNIVGNLSRYFTELEGRAVSTAEVMERVTKRMVSFADVEEIFKRMTDEGGEFYKMQEVQADTVKGQINKLHDAYDQMLNTIGQANQGTIRKFVEILNNMVRNWRDIVPLIKSSVAILGTYVAVTKLARMGTQKYGDAIVRLRLGKKKQTVEMEAALVKETLLLNKQAKTITAWQYLTQKAIFNVKMAWKALGGIFKSFAPFLAIEGALYAFNKIMEPIREARRLSEDLANIRVENKSRADEEVNNYDKLIRRFNELNRGSIERKEIIDKLNSQYGKYIGFQVSETTTLNDLADAQERVNLNIREKARLRAEEEAQQRIAEDYMRRENKLLNPTQAWGVKDVYTFLYNDASMLSGKNTMWLANVEKFAEYAQTKIHDLTDEELKSRQELVNATGEWLNTFYGVSGATEISKGLVDLVELYAEQEQKLRDERKQISEDLKGLPLQVQEDIMSMQSQVATAMQKLTKAEAGEKVEIPLLDYMRIIVPPDLAEKSGVWEVIKQEINKRQEDFKIKLKLDAGAITEDQAEELRKQAKTTGDIFVDAVNKEISEGILKDAGIEGTFDELKEQIIDYPEMISDWNKVDDAIELINSNLITASDITNGLTNYTKILSENLGNGREAIDEAVKRQNLLVDGTEEEVKKAQEAVDKAKERYKWLLKIAKLLGLDTKSADEIVEEEGYDLSVGQFRLAAAQSAFMEKFGKASNAYGKQLSQIGVTENLKEVADAYHKQSDELDGLIKNQEKALENETNLTEEQKENAKTTIENLKEQKSMAEFLAEFFGYVPKKTTTRTTHENASKLISLIKEMRSEYDKLSKSAYGYAKSEEKVRDAYRDSAKAILEKAGVTEDYDFTTNEGMIAALDKVLAYANKLGPEAAAEVQKYIDQLETEIEINAQVRIREDFGKQMEKAFGDYELTLELDKLNLPKGLAADMWGIEETDLQDLRKKLSQMYTGLRDENGQLSDEAFKDYEKFLNKIDDLERKLQKERLKDYSKYLEAQYSERVKIEMDYVRKLAALESETAIKEPQKREIREGLKREFLEKSRKQDWEDFKGSEFYVGMMEDLEKQGSASLEVMRKKLLEMRENAENLSPRALKEVVNALEKIDELEKKRIPPLRRIREEQEKLSGIEIKDVYERIAANQEKLAQDEQEQKDLERMIMLEEERQKLEKQGITLEEAKARLARSEQALSLILPSLDTRSDGTKEGEERRRILTETVNQAKKEVENWAEIVRILSGQAVIDEQERGSKYKGLSLPDLKKRRDDAKQRIKDLEGLIGKDEELVKAQKDLEDAWNDTWEAAKRWAQSINGIFDGVMDTVGYFSDSTSTLTDGWKEFGDTSISALTDLVGGIQAYQQANAAAKKAGLATGLFTANGLQLAMVILGVIIKIVQAIAKMHDARIDKEIEQSKERVDDLQKAYDRLEKSIEKTFDTVSYIREYNQEVQNLNEQIEEANNQIAAAQDYKSEEKKKEAIEAAEDAKQEALDALEEIKQAQIEVFGGIGRDSYRSAAEGFVDAWKSAFLETGDGLQGLQDHFDEFLNDWFTKQLTMKYAAAALKPLFSMMDAAVDQYGPGGVEVIQQELDEMREWAKVYFPQIADELEKNANIWSLDGEGGLSGLAAGIQGMTEEQANILEAYWNSVRGYTANIDMNVSRIAQILGAGGDNSNPMLAQMTLVAQNTNNINTLLQSVTKSGHSQGGYGIKVFAD